MERRYYTTARISFEPRRYSPKVRTMARKSRGRFLSSNVGSSPYFNNFKKTNSQTKSDSPLPIELSGVKVILNKNANCARRVVWFVIFAGCLSLCSYQVVDRVTLYLRNPIGMHVRVTRNQSVKFPSFTICPYDIDSTAAIRRAQFEYSEMSDGKTTKNVWNLLDYANFTTSQMWDLNAITENNTHVNFVMKKMLPTEVRPVIKKIPRKFAFLGTCMTVAVEGNVDFMGPAFVMRVEQDVDESVSFNEVAAFTIYPHEDNTPALHHAFFKGQIIQRGQMTSIALDVSTFNFLNSTTKPCRDAITATMCWTRCLEKILTNRTSCRLPFMTSTKRNCTAAFESGTTYNATLNMYLTTRRQDCNCPSKCVDIVYDMDIDIQERLNNVTIAEIYFQQNNFQVISEFYSYGFVSLVCDVGGNLGFYLGFCILTIIEIIEKLLSSVRDTAKIVG